MIQQINLYAHLPKRSRVELTREMAAVIFIIMLVILFIVYFVQKITLIHLKQRLENITAEVSVVEKQYAELNAKYPISDIESLSKTVKESMVKLDRKEEAINLLSFNAVFSSYLLALANTNVAGLWLTEIKIDNTQQKIDFIGLTLQSNLVEKFLVQLDVQPVFANKIRFELDDLSDKTTPSVFRITNKIENAMQ